MIGCELLAAAPASAALLRLQLFHQTDERQRDLVQRVNDSDLECCRRLPCRASAVIARPAASAIVVVEDVAARAGVLS